MAAAADPRPPSVQPRDRTTVLVPAEECSGNWLTMSICRREKVIFFNQEEEQSPTLSLELFEAFRQHRRWWPLRQTPPHRASSRRHCASASASSTRRNQTQRCAVQATQLLFLLIISGR
eukprot:TRINITY_DN26264_c0_g3_i1.p2 TRINITY_DN26264_c0_g3~~TRINITY_DN26264_c0_g3_i1.p2  ORF type:complete len:119 (+),score=13.18 TRINITY_DN26264_c0_g3_i1:91-447(+)